MVYTKKTAPDANGVQSQEAKNAVTTLLKYLGENPSRHGLEDTPDRVCRALLEMTEGYQLDAEEVLSTTFESNSDENIIVKDIDFASICEHHLLSFTGKVHIGYIPSNGKIVGLSKLARVVDVFSKRLQVQERMTEQIANAIKKSLDPKGVAVVVEGSHSCMCVRGVGKNNAKMVTSFMLGDFRNNPASRHEFLSLINRST